ncbi:DNA-binding NarL/FixJ family response regulator [Algoriphagus sp. 4150]|uniref:response regulator transcription factor n=1 Tax=Algoriphagus sp. 4150 TaxID=2817756 RepID=UPI0028658297|nr:response regulator transcription factor [Algoriphagus sp. 4150]MDR7127915.1 DNA-binding NarL/FixJ family response regulator [Algoriphagus sp. 4150]
MSEGIIKIILVDDHPIVLQGFIYMFKDNEEIQLQATFPDAEKAIEFLQTNAVDVVLMDINLNGQNGIEACQVIKKKYPDVKVVGISNINEHSIIQRMLSNGASGYLLKNASKEEVISCITLAMEGTVALSKSIKEIMRSHDKGDIPAVTRREKEILSLLASGLNSGEIGEKIFISPLTVESHRRNLLQKFKVGNVAALIHKATELKYI